MSVNGKIAGISAAGAFLLSALIGVISGVTFGTLLLRALVSAALFGGGSFAACMLLERYTPELISSPSADQDSAGGHVDISVGEDDDYGNEESPSGSELPRQDTRGGFDDSLVEEVEEAPAESRGVERSPAARSAAEDARSDAAQRDDVEPDDDGALPSFDGLASEFGGDSSETGESMNESSPPGSDGVAAESESDQKALFSSAESDDDEAQLDSIEGSPDSGSEGGDPKVMADAIRTVLKREG